MVNATILAWLLGPFGCVAATVAGESEPTDWNFRGHPIRGGERLRRPASAPRDAGDATLRRALCAPPAYDLRPRSCCEIPMSDYSCARCRLQREVGVTPELCRLRRTRAPTPPRSALTPGIRAAT
jgi:hypothetical protein